MVINNGMLDEFEDRKLDLKIRDHLVEAFTQFLIGIYRDTVARLQEICSHVLEIAKVEFPRKGTSICLMSQRLLQGIQKVGSFMMSHWWLHR